MSLNFMLFSEGHFWYWNSGLYLIKILKNVDKFWWHTNSNEIAISYQKNIRFGTKVISNHFSVIYLEQIDWMGTEKKILNIYLKRFQYEHENNKKKLWTEYLGVKRCKSHTTIFKEISESWAAQEACAQHVLVASHTDFLYYFLLLCSIEFC